MRWLLLLVLIFTLFLSKEATGNVCDKICGRRPMAISDNLRILGGMNAMPGSWPWVVSFQFLTRHGYRHFCAGSLINSRWVVSSAHCFYIQKFLKVEYWRVQIGATERSKPGPDAQTRSIKRLVDHEHYSRRLNLNDITLIELDRPVVCNNYVQPACLPSKHLPIHSLTHCYICGWGVTNITRRPIYADILQEAKVHLISNHVCNSTYYSESIRNDNLCAMANEGKIDRCEVSGSIKFFFMVSVNPYEWVTVHSCGSTGDHKEGEEQGDGGGPLMCREAKSERFWVVGITSWGRGCTMGKWPGVFTSTQYFLPWIVNILQNPPESALVPPFIPTPPPPTFDDAWYTKGWVYVSRVVYTPRRSTWAKTSGSWTLSSRITRRRWRTSTYTAPNLPPGLFYPVPTQKTTVSTQRPKWLIEHYQHMKTWPSYWPTPQP